MRTLSFVAGFLLAGCVSTSDPGILTAARTLDSPPEEVSGDALGHYMASVIYQRIGDEENALKELRAAADLSPGSAWIQERLLLAYYRSGDFENASVMAERAVANDPQSIPLRIWLGQIYFQLENYDQAVDTFMEAINLDPNRTMGYEALEDVQGATNDLVGTLRVYEKLAERNAEAPLLHLQLGLNLIRISDSEGARVALERALELQPDMARASFLLGIVQQSLGNFESAANRFETFLEAQPDHRGAKLNLAGSYAQLGRYDDAVRALSELIEKNQGDAALYLHRTYLWLRSETLPDASLAIAPSDAPIVGTLLEALARKQVGEPYQELVASLDSLEGDVNAEFGAYGFELLSLFGEEDTEKFLEEQFTSLLKDGFRSRTIEILYGRMLMARDRHAEAKEVLIGVAEHFGSERSLHYHIASVCEELKQRDLVEKHLRVCLEIDPEDADSMNFLGYMYAEQNIRLDEAEELIEKALLIEPDNGFFLDSLGWVHYRKGDAEKAIDLIRRAVRSNDMSNDDPVLREHLGDAYLLAGQIRNAVAEWSRAIRMDPDADGLAKKIDRYKKRARKRSGFRKDREPD